MQQGVSQFLYQKQPTSNKKLVGFSLLPVAIFSRFLAKKKRLQVLTNALRFDIIKKVSVSALSLTRVELERF